jgi:hypothetical protein
MTGKSKVVAYLKYIIIEKSGKAAHVAYLNIGLILYCNSLLCFVNKLNKK